MANLLFKKGNYKDFKDKVLTGNAAVEGALYFTEDEGSLYIGKTGGEVVRVQGTVHQYDTLKAFGEGVTPPYSQDVIYFIAEKNALVRYDGSNWIQLNATAADTAAEVARLEGLITTNKNSIATNTASIKTNTDAIASHKTLIEKLREDVDAKATQVAFDALEDKVEANEGNITTLQGQMANKAESSKVSEIESAVGKNTEDIGTLNQNLTALSGVVDTKAAQADLNTLSGKVTTNEGNITTLQGQMANKAESSKVGEIETQVGKNTGDIANIKLSLDNKVNTSTYEGLASRVGTAEGKITTLEGQVDALNQSKASVTQLNLVGDRVTDIENALPNKVDKVEGKQLSTEDYTTAEKTKLASIAEGATKVIVDTALNDTSENPVQNKVISAKLNAITSTLNEQNAAIQGAQGEISSIIENYVTNATYSEKMTALDKDIADINKMLGTSGDGTSVGDRLNALEQDNTTNKTNISDLQTALGTLTGRVDTAEGDIDSLEGRADAIEGRLDGLDTKTNTTNTNLTNLTNRVGTAEGKITAAEGKISDLESAVGTLQTNSATKEELNKLSTDLKAEIDSDIIAANAMTYKGGIASDVELTAKTPSIGDTYVVTTAFGDYQAGDLLIATSTDNTETDGIIPEDKLKWDHVSTGYSDIHDPSLTAADNKLILKDFGGEELGVVTIASTSNNIAISTSNNTISIGLEWDTF